MGFTVLAENSYDSYKDKAGNRIFGEVQGTKGAQLVYKLYN